MAKNILDKKAAASISPPALQFLQEEKQKYIHITGLTNYLTFRFLRSKK